MSEMIAIACRSVLACRDRQPLGVVVLLPAQRWPPRLPTTLDPPLPRQRSRGAARRPPPAHRRHAVARPGDGQRPVAGHAARETPGARALLGHGLRLAKGGGEAERPAAVHDRDRRGRHSLHPRPLEASECPAADHDARLARLGHRAAQDHRSAHRSHGAWRKRRGRLRPRHPVDARLRLLRQADRTRAGIPTASRAPGRS